MLASPAVADLPLTPFYGTPYGPLEKRRFHLEGRQCAASRPHRALKFGKDMLTPAMQAGVVSKRLTFREVFMAVAVILLCVVILLLGESGQEQDESLRLAA